MEKYRFDNAYEKVYKYDEGVYFFVGSYFSFGITKAMPNKTKFGIVNESLHCPDEMYFK